MPHGVANWAVWGGGSFMLTDKATFNVQASYDEMEDFAVVANVAYELVPNFVITPEIAYIDNFNDAFQDWYEYDDGRRDLLTRELGLLRSRPDEFWRMMERAMRGLAKKVHGGCNRPSVDVGGVCPGAGRTGDAHQDGRHRRIRSAGDQVSRLS